MAHHVKNVGENEVFDHETKIRLFLSVFPLNFCMLLPQKMRVRSNACDQFPREFHIYILFNLCFNCLLRSLVVIVRGLSLCTNGALFNVFLHTASDAWPKNRCLMRSSVRATLICSANGLPCIARTIFLVRDFGTTTT